ncbi:KxYKxGKxW signal peptide domain-containing protein [Limosilactobacillus reuteri]|uniref:KxYKxGKxW signal peptide domain-containing protein n=1 Tax=Limosilactobacillus reuteri TaxID=1598 RepID=UPI00081C17CE|nr:KxYKxGKxW signal peptide domain-containing protein [Limosilactobacillus reuteri]MCH5378975.1 KxYKxGKxW signal peptide domain-containing protein [Limosilactobacillus reuteri]OCW64536.1 hypothetical protein BBP10_04915 [Limosilactobacillus reuteri]OCW65176.1 hypothetical protein BBP11_00215 [Limosilactobacillus reuteri]OCW66465.1 hypothetical protein BBP12_02545 [Limosilactobacillus reuteri]OCW68786.1 hypothetical protein BBP13_07070 [Limosilactobacillus reuteri]
MKEHKKLYKSGKNWVVATMAVASLGVVALQQNASADTVNTDSATQVTNDTGQVAAQKEAVTNAQGEVNAAKNAVDTQQSQVNAAQAQVNAQQKLVNEKQNTLNTAQKNLDEAKNNVPTDKATIQKQINDAQDAIKHDNTNIASQTKDVDNAQKALDSAEKSSDAQKLQEQVNNDQAKLDKLQQQFDQLNVNNSAAGFFKYLADSTQDPAQKQDAENAYKMMMGQEVTINGTVVKPAPWYNEVSSRLADLNSQMPSSIKAMSDLTNNSDPDNAVAMNSTNRFIENRIRLYNFAKKNNATWLNNYKNLVINGENNPFISLTAMAATLLDADSKVVTGNPLSAYYTSEFPSLFVDHYYTDSQWLTKVKKDGTTDIYGLDEINDKVPSSQDIDNIYKNKDNLNQRISAYVNNQLEADRFGENLGTDERKDAKQAFTERLKEVNPYMKSLGMARHGFKGITMGLSTLPGTYTSDVFETALANYLKEYGISYSEEIDALKGKINLAQGALKLDKEALAKVVSPTLQTNLDNAKKTLQVSKDKLVKDTATLNDAKQALTNFDKTVAQKQTELQQAKNAVNKAQEDFNESNKKLEEQNNSLNQDKAKLNELQQVLAVKQQALTAAQAKLSALTTPTKSDNNNDSNDQHSQNSDGDTIKTVNNAEEKGANNAPVELSKVGNQNQTQQVQGLADYQVTLQSEHGTKMSAQSSTVAPVSVSKQAVNENHDNSVNKLPQTGNQESIAAIALGAVAAMFGLSLAKKREY